MKRFLTALSFVFAFTASTLYAQSTIPDGLHPILVPESAFAIRLAFAFGIVNTENAIEAEDRLANAGIAPNNGWVSEYPVTPSTLLELWTAIDVVAIRGRLPMIDNDTEAWGIYKDVVSEFGFNASLVGPDGSPPPPPPSLTEIVEYYSSNDVPIYTYYEPPSVYVGMYVWLPVPFWFGGFLWPGYWMLRDFHRPIYYHGHGYYISNHYLRPNGEVIILNPARRGHWPVQRYVPVRPVVPDRPTRVPIRTPNHGGWRGGHGHH